MNEPSSDNHIAAQAKCVKLCFFVIDGIKKTKIEQRQEQMQKQTKNGGKTERKKQ